ncbi:hypothetical protein FNV43_RR04486 [Rhamnella rubrinervis]|uniref:Uncharacterized protein n=1 Tax=Rhamnella rubrinervis TaxID=2594499 RepID=A0A8K0MQ44_9ROSA|nr:hypothetical protein FNV43_RR04486 [Rhamnella rubrinervis]
MNSLSSKLRPNPTSSFFYAHLRAFCASPPPPSPSSVIHSPSATRALICPPLRRDVRVRVGLSDAQLKENWLASLSCPFPLAEGIATATATYFGNGESDRVNNAASEWVLGVDPDTGAFSILKGDDFATSAQVFDTPQLQVLVGKRVRKRLDAKSIVQLLCSLMLPLVRGFKFLRIDEGGTTAYLEQSIPYPKDGKQGWWSGGFGYGVWIGILVALGFSVVPVPSSVWKKKFELSGSRYSKDDSRLVASSLFPSLSSLLKRKKDHGRAEALLIAAYGKDLKMKSDSSFTLEEIVS